MNPRKKTVMQLVLYTIVVKTKKKSAYVSEKHCVCCKPSKICPLPLLFNTKLKSIRIHFIIKAFT